MLKANAIHVLSSQYIDGTGLLRAQLASGWWSNRNQTDAQAPRHRDLNQPAEDQRETLHASQEKECTIRTKFFYSSNIMFKTIDSN